MAVDEYFLCCSGLKSQGSGEGQQCIYMRILLARYIVNVEVFEILYNIDSYIMIRHQVFKSYFVLPANLIDDEL